MRRILEGTKLSHVPKVKLKTITYKREIFLFLDTIFSYKGFRRECLLILDTIFNDKGFRVKQDQAI